MEWMEARMVRVIGSLLVGAGIGLVPVAEAWAGQRHFAYTYESAVVSPGSVELEPWSTARLGRETFYARFDHRLELEAGIARGVQAALYFNWHALTEGPSDERSSEFEWSGVSMEWKFKLLDPVADVLGLALYLEPGVGPSEGEVEAKVIVDKRIGAFLVALNATGEFEAAWGGQEVEKEGAVELTAGLGWFLSPGVLVGVELRNHNQIVEGGEWEHSALHAGPVVHVAGKQWWATLTGMVQLPALKGATDGTYVLDEHERAEVRLLVGVDL